MQKQFLNTDTDLCILCLCMFLSPHVCTLCPPPHSHTPQEDGAEEEDLDRSSELLLFHEAINNLVESEEQLIEEHKSIIEADQYLLEEETQLLRYVGGVDHDIEGEHVL